MFHVTCYGWLISRESVHQLRAFSRLLVTNCVLPPTRSIRYRAAGGPDPARRARLPRRKGERAGDSICRDRCATPCARSFTWRCCSAISRARSLFILSSDEFAACEFAVREFAVSESEEPLMRTWKAGLVGCLVTGMLLPRRPGCKLPARQPRTANPRTRQRLRSRPSTSTAPWSAGRPVSVRERRLDRAHRRAGGSVSITAFTDLTTAPISTCAPSRALSPAARPVQARSHSRCPIGSR